VPDDVLVVVGPRCKEGGPSPDRQPAEDFPEGGPGQAPLPRPCFWPGPPGGRPARAGPTCPEEGRKRKTIPLVVVDRACRPHGGRGRPRSSGIRSRPAPGQYDTCGFSA